MKEYFLNKEVEQEARKSPALYVAWCVTHAYQSWYSTFNRKFGVCDASGFVFGLNKIGTLPAAEIIKEPNTIINGVDGSMCSACSNFIPYAEPDQSPYVCFSCRSYRNM